MALQKHKGYKILCFPGILSVYLQDIGEDILTEGPSSVHRCPTDFTNLS